jgi:hypothetical protein
MQNFQNPKEDKDQEGFWEDWESWWKNPDFGIKQATNQAELSLIAGTIIGVIKDLQQEAKSKKPACGNQVFNDIIKFAEEQQKIAEERLKQAIVDASKTSRTATKIKKPSGSLSSVDNLSTPLLSKKAGKGVASD